jgi:hypothetical protein
MSTDASGMSDEVIVELTPADPEESAKTSDHRKQVAAGIRYAKEHYGLPDNSPAGPAEPDDE